MRLSLTKTFFKIVILGCLILVLNLIVADFAKAATCRQLGGHSFCLVTIKRSAKNYWEYRAVISVDGQKQPLEIYNCRDRTKIDHHKMIIPFADDGVGELVCSLYRK